MPETDDAELNPAETARAAKKWAEWAAHDLKHFLTPLAEATGMTRLEVLLYLVSERLAQIAEGGVQVRLFATHEITERPPEDPEDEAWKK